MKVKKRVPGTASDIAVGDVVDHYGTVVFVGRNEYGEVHFAYLNGNGLCTELVDDDCSVTLVREAETPDSVAVGSYYGDTLLIEDTEWDESGSIQITAKDGVGNVLMFGRMFDATKVIDAIKTVKGLE